MSHVALFLLGDSPLWPECDRNRMTGPSTWPFVWLDDLPDMADEGNLTDTDVPDRNPRRTP